eukprot:1616620-Rhodomonas_salina.2
MRSVVVVGSTTEMRSVAVVVGSTKDTASRDTRVRTGHGIGQAQRGLPGSSSSSALAPLAPPGSSTIIRYVSTAQRLAECIAIRSLSTVALHP